ncbi:MAG: Tim44/TimA family putative adaptor protein [Pseudomonadota bacterium]
MSGELIELLVLCALAAIVLYRLKTVIGTRTGHEPTRDGIQSTVERAQPSGPVAVPDIPPEEVELADEGLAEQSRAALAGIREIEPGFDVRGFVDGARGAYEMILMAYEEGDRGTLKALLADDVYAAFEAGISAREAEGLRVEARFIGVREADVDEVNFDEGTRVADVTVRFVGELITAVRDAENRVVEGDPNEIRRQSDQWTFSRVMGSSDPNWQLTGTGG